MGRAVSDKWLAAGSHLVIGLVSCALLAVPLILLPAPLKGQIYFGNPYDAGLGAQRSHGNLRGISGAPEPAAFVIMNTPAPAPAPAAPPSTVSRDLLRHPLSHRALGLLRKATRIAKQGDHAAAIAVLRQGLVQQPAAAPYIHTQLGVEYLETHQFGSAVAAFAEAARIMPRDAAAHSNYGLSLAVAGQLGLAEKELLEALALDHTNEKAKDILDELHAFERASPSPAR
jgi:tetratricopeptide (TPR) repeat protein